MSEEESEFYDWLEEEYEEDEWTDEEFRDATTVNTRIREIIQLLRGARWIPPRPSPTS